MSPSILLVDDHSMVRNGIKATLKTNFGYTDIGEVGSCSGLMQELKNKAYTHLLLDINLTDGSSIEVLYNIRVLYPDLRIAILTMLPSIMLRKVARNNSIDFIIGKAEMEVDINRKLMFFLQNEDPGKPDLDWETDNPFSDFSSREMEVLHYWLKGLKTKEIAAQLNLAVQSITTYKSRIRDKARTDNIKDLEALAEAFGINS